MYQVTAAPSNHSAGVEDADDRDVGSGSGRSRSAVGGSYRTARPGAAAGDGSVGTHLDPVGAPVLHGRDATYLVVQKTDEAALAYLKKSPAGQVARQILLEHDRTVELHPALRDQTLRLGVGRRQA